MADTQTPAPPAARVSALVLSYNDAPNLRRCLTALDASSLRGEMEIIVLDNGSTDGSSTMDSEFQNITFLRLPRNFGATKALNIGLRSAAGEYLLFLAPEIELEPKAIAQLVAALDADTDAVAACPYVVDESGRFAGDVFKIPNRAELKAIIGRPDALQRITSAEQDSVLPVEYAGRSALLARKFFVKGINHFDERYGDFGADLELAFQIRRSRKRTLLVPAARAVRHPAPPLPSSASNILMADRAAGAAGFLAKHYGFLSGFGFRAAAALAALGRLRPALFLAIASGSKVDGSQTQL
jgi:GT2 family glycosyltransferase